MTNRQEDTVLEKLRMLPPERVAEVKDFVDFLCLRDEEHKLTHAAAKLAEPVFQHIWDNPDDADYDRL